MGLEELNCSLLLHSEQSVTFVKAGMITNVCLKDKIAVCCVLYYLVFIRPTDGSSCKVDSNQY